MSGKYRLNKPENIQWIPGTKNISYTLGNAILTKTADSLTQRTILTIDSIAVLFKTSNPKVPEYFWLDSSTFAMQLDSTIIFYNYTQHKQIRRLNLPYNADNIDIDNSKQIAFTIGNNLVIMDSLGKQSKVTNNISCVTSGGKYVYREEFGTKKATFWSPDGESLAYYSNNELKIPSYPRLEYTSEFAKVNTIKYPFVGEANQLVTVYVYNIALKKRVRLNTGEIDHYLTNITWSPDGQYIYLFDLSRNQKECTLKRYNVKTGNLDNEFFTEKNDKYVEPLYPLYFTSNSSFLYVSRKSGYNQIYYYRNDSFPVNSITKQTMEVHEIIGIENQCVYYSAIDQNRPLEEHLFKTDITSGITKQLSSETGVHAGILNESNGLLLDEYSNIACPYNLDIFNEKNKVRKTVFSLDDPFKLVDFPYSEFISIPAADDSTRLYGCLIKPCHYDSSKKYPVIVNVYGGPHVQMVKNEWLLGNGFIPYYLASKGYIVFMLDNRGSANRGLAFENCTHLTLGNIETADQLRGIQFLKKHPSIDTNRIGVYGESFGGFMTLTLMEQAPQIFKVGVCGSPVTDWKYYEVMYGERYMGTPQTNPLGFNNSSTINKVKNIKGKLLLINGGLDHVTVINNSMAFLNECIKNNVQIDYFLYPNHDHHVMGKDRTHFLFKMSNYFLNNL